MTRTSIHLESFAHENPVPVASRIGPYLYSGVLTARDPRTKEIPEGLDEQVAVVFERIRELMAAAGGGTGDIVKLTFWVSELRDRTAINREWVAMFPDPADRPARQVMAARLDRGALVQCDVVAVLAADAREHRR
ncbi:RidA family protein [Agromyces larvae]|uniref:RidA family protein n=1 Tax=Agromyces larvae TaxID=2929802 RepID=A0ABY4BYN4_9MICO|nr:RidA family protein [Agromyces larvae]UOE43307.1 RidA family protein [Agromyces larvae]